MYQFWPSIITDARGSIMHANVALSQYGKCDASILLKLLLFACALQRFVLRRRGFKMGPF